MDVLLSLALIVVGVFNVVASLVLVNEMRTSRMMYGGTPGDENLGRYMMTGLIWMSFGLLEGICWGIGAVDLWA